MEYITKLICQKSNISYLVIDQNFSLLDFSDTIESIVDDPTALTYGADIRDILWEFVGIEDRMMYLYENENEELHFPMILKGSEYYDLDIGLFEDSIEKYFIAYLTKKTRESLSYANTIKEINKKTLIYQNEKRGNKEEHYTLINKRVLNFNVDMNGRITLVNSAFEHFFDLSKEKILGEHFSTFFKTRETDFNTKESIILNATNLNDEVISFYANIIPMSKDNKIYENIMICQDITYLKEVEKELEFAAGHDSLTGLPNRSQLLRKIDEAIEHTDKSQNSFSLCFIDLDNFQRINDNYGHHAGDMLLKHIAKMLTNLVRKDDIVARIGGDKFIILFDALSAKSSIKIMIERIKELPEKNPLVYTENDTIGFDFSLGVASYPKDAKNGLELIKIADNAMYLAKRSSKVHP